MHNLIDLRLQDWTDLFSSARQLQSLYFMTRGFSAAKTANLLNLSKRTIEQYQDSVKSKLGLLNKAEVITMVLDTGLYQDLHAEFNKSLR